MGFVLRTQDEVLTLSANDSPNLHLYVGAAFGVRLDIRSHAGRTFIMGFGAMSSSSTKQKVSSRSSTEAEFIAVDEYTSKDMWSKRLTEAQGFNANLNIFS